MLRFYVRFTVIPVLLFTLALLLIHVQPYDDHELRQLLLPEGCPAPCFIGIRPGVTTMDEAEQLLNNNSWVKKITFNSGTYISWMWSDQRPVWIRPIEGGLVGYNDRVTYIEFSTVLSLGTILLEMGPNLILEHQEYEPIKSTLYTVGYPDHYLHFEFVINCPNQMPYSQPVNILVETIKGENNSDLYNNLQKSFFTC